MRANLNTARYAPAPVPAEAAALPGFLGAELAKVAAAIQLLALGHVDVNYAPPPRPRDGDIRLADGSHWDPGDGAGVYAYYGGTWNRLG